MERPFATVIAEISPEFLHHLQQVRFRTWNLRKKFFHLNEFVSKAPETCVRGKKRLTEKDLEFLRHTFMQKNYEGFCILLMTRVACLGTT